MSPTPGAVDSGLLDLPPVDWTIPSLDLSPSDLSPRPFTGTDAASPAAATPQADPSEWPTWDNPDIIPVADRDGRPIDILEEDALGGHTYERHVGKSDEYLKGRIRGIDVNIPMIGEFRFSEKRAGSFTSLEAANKLVNSVLSDPDNTDKLEAFIRGDFLFPFPTTKFIKRFGSPTGYEYYTPNGKTTPYRRQTDSVEVWLYRSSSSPKGFYVDSAFPMSQD